MATYCMDCGTKLITVNYTTSCTKYECEKCNNFWYRSTITKVVWNKEKKTIKGNG